MKRKKKYYLSFVLIIVIIIQALGVMPVSATNNEEVSGTIEVVSNISEDIMKQYLDDFKNKYPKLEVKYRYYSNYENEVKNCLLNDDYGDVLFIPSFVNSSSYSTYFMPLGSMDELQKKYNYMESSKNTNNVVYGIPSSAYITGILYNKDVFYQAGITQNPKTTEEFLQAMINIKERTDAIPFYTNCAAFWTLPLWEQFPYIEMTGSANYQYNIFVDELNPFLEGSTHYTVYKLLYDMVSQGLCEDTPSASNWDKSKTMLNAGEIGCIAIGSWAVSQFKDAGPNADAIAFMPFPNEINGRQYMTISTDYCYAINKDSENKEAARAYIDFMLDESGYALDHETLSMVKTDPYPDSYGNMENIILLSTTPATADTYKKWKKLTSGVSLEDGSGAKRVIEAASGVTDESFDDIVQDWNKQWEAKRTWEVQSEEKKVEAVLSSAIVAEDYEIFFSQTEQQYINSLNQLKIGYLKNLAPIQYEIEGGFTGVALEICQTIEENTGITLEYRAYDNTQQMIEALQAGEIDIIAAIDKSADYDADIQYSKEYLSFMNVLVHNDSISTDFEQNGVCGKVEGEKNLLNDGEESVVVKSKTYEQVLQLIEAGRADYCTLNYYSADYYMELLECDHLTMLPMSETGSLCLAFGKNVDTRLISICNKCIYGIPDKNVQVMLREYMVQPEKEVTLKRFIEDNPITCIMVVFGFCALVVVAVILVMREKNKSAQKHAMDMQKYEFLASLVNEYLFEYDYQTDTISFDDKFRKKFGLPKKLCMKDFQVSDEQEKVLESIYRQYKNMKDDGGLTTAFQLWDKDNEVQWYRVFAHIIRDKNNKPQQLIGKVMNVQKEIEEKKEIEDKAHKDPLTGLYNREGFMNHLNSLYENGEKMEPLTVAVVDFDSFKSVNDTLGHAGGDVALCFLADTLKELFAKQAITARYGGDEFMLILYGVEEEKVRELFTTLVRRMDTELVYHNVSKKISISLGAVFTEEQVSFEEMFKAADKVLYESKNAGKNRYGMMRFQEVESA